MKVILLILASVSVSFGYPIVKTWTYPELSKATKKVNIFQPSADKAPLVHAFDVMVTYIFIKQDYVNAVLSPTGGKEWTKTQLEQALNDTDTNEYHLEYIVKAYTALKRYNDDPANKGKETDTIQVWILALDISTWTKEDLTKALKDPSIKPDLVPHLREAQKEFDEYAAKREKKETVTIVTPVGLILPPESVVPVIIKLRKTINESKNKV